MGKLTVIVKLRCPHCGHLFRGKMVSSTTLQFIQKLSTKNPAENRKLWARRKED